MIKVDKYRYPKKRDKSLLNYLSQMGFSLDCIKKIPIVSKPNTYELKCHRNVIRYISLYGGERILGYYLLIDESNKLILIKHSILKTNNGDCVDITPFSDNRAYNIFIEQETEKESYVIGSFDNDMDDTNFEEDFDF